MPFDYAVHSNLLIHWTGIDIDKKYDQYWYMKDSSKTPCPRLEEEYLERLLNILKYGLWMTPEKELTLSFGEEEEEYTFPEVSRTCFTELRLSQARVHAKRYGRLGIGVKRPFVFKRGGRPVIYYGPKKHQDRDNFLKNCAQSLTEKNLLHYFKAMNSSDTPNYDFYAESEWRIISNHELTDSVKVVNPREDNGSESTKYFASLPKSKQDRLRYLLPIDGWLSCIIYPSVSLKNKVQKDEQIRSEIKRIKKDLKDEANRIEGGNLPTEMDIDMCRNF